MKAIILAAGIGSRIKPLTDNCPKSLLMVGGRTILDRMLSNIQDCGITDIIFVLGYLEDQIRDYVEGHFPHLNGQFIVNDRYTETNTGYSLMLTKEFVGDAGFIKFDADVVFDKAILEKLIASPHSSCLCIDKNIRLDAEEIKVIIEGNSRVVKVNKTVNPADAIGESVGIEKIDPQTAKVLFSELELMMKDAQHHQAYYEGAYERLIDKGIAFYALNITGHNWTEIDTEEDLRSTIQLLDF